MFTRILAAGMLALSAVSARAAEQLATVAGKPITRAQVEEHSKAKLDEIERTRYEALREGLDEMVQEALFAEEAKARKISVEQLEKQEIDDKVAKPTDAEIQQLYDANKQQIGERSLDAVKDQIIEFLHDHRAQERRADFVKELKAKYPTTVSLRPPITQVEEAGRPSQGPANAPVKIIEFSDYECPFCKRAEGTVQEVVKAYGDKVRLVYRDYPLPFHDHARPAAEAAACANAQGKFWDYHNKLMASKDLSADKLKSLADEVGLDRAKFDDCIANKPHAAAIEKDMADGAKAGVNGTPSFFINGRMLDGAQPFEKFKEVIDEEISWAQQKKS
jgi:protein-disulfide isomerase